MDCNNLIELFCEQSKAGKCFDGNNIERKIKMKFNSHCKESMVIFTEYLSKFIFAE